MMIDLRSDTVTRPTDAMRRAMAGAEVGDDVFLEDPTALRLEARAAEVLGKEAALFTPTGTMANQLALLVHCDRGDEVIVGEGAHCYFYEQGAGAAIAGVQFVEVGEGGLFDPDEMEGGVKPDVYYMARTRLVALENTHNRSGGRVFPRGQVVAIAARARERGLATHMDGARIWNAAVATDKTPAEIAAPMDTVSACFSKGLGAPMGSVLAGPADLIRDARRYRRMLGAGMRQIGLVCAAALHALDHHRERLIDDHDNAQRLARGLAAIEGLRCDPSAVETNIVNFDLLGGSAQSLAERAGAAGVGVIAIGPSRLRAVTHLDVSSEEVARAVEILGRLVAAA